MTPALYPPSYEAWKADPTPERLGSVLEDLRPTIRHATYSTGSSGDPRLEMEAELLTAEAVRRYDPTSNVNMKTWVSRQLQGLRRIRREKQHALRIPERIQLNAWELAKAERNLLDRLGREPTDEELADEAKLSIRQLENVRKTFRPIASESAAGGLSLQTPDYGQEAMDYVYQDSDTLDKKIMELKLGYGGRDPADHKTVAARLQLKPFQLSRRIARLTQKLEAMNDNLTS